MADEQQPKPERRSGLSRPRSGSRTRAALKRERQKSANLEELLRQATASAKVTSGTATYDGVTYFDGEPVSRSGIGDLFQHMRAVGREDRARQALQHFTQEQLRAVRHNLCQSGHATSPAVALLDEYIGTEATG